MIESCVKGGSEIFDRMMEAARESGLQGHSDVARALGEFPQTITNWQARGVPAAKIMDIAARLGCDPYWLRDGVQRGGVRVVEGAAFLMDKDVLAMAQAIALLPEDKRRAFATLLQVPFGG